MKNLSNIADRQSIATRLAQLTPTDAARWGSMNVHQMICHLNDSYNIALGQKKANSVSGPMKRTLIKWFALKTPMQWPKGVPTLPEVEQGKGGSAPVDFREDLALLQGSVQRFCDQLPRPPADHAIFGAMTVADWTRWGYLHADHHLRQFGR